MRQFWVCLWMLLSFCASGKAVDSVAARKVAAQFASRNFPSVPAVSNGQLVTEKMTIPGIERDLCFLFRIPSGGFILVAGDDRATPVLAWSDEVEATADSMPGLVRHWIEGYQHDLAWLKSVPDQGVSRFATQWAELRDGNPSVARKTNSVSPMLTTRWNQSKFYNADCPRDSSANTNALTGCVATVMAQLMRYWQWPETGIGFHAYDDNSYGVLSANFGHTHYNWASMPNALTTSNTEVAQIMFHAGVSVNMDYGVSSSSSYVLSTNCPLRYNAQFSLINYFCYKPGIKGLFRQDFNNDSWLSVIEGELQAGRPVVYNGMNDSEGHSFIADGFDNSNRLHFNWGWGGSYNGYYSIDSIVPDTISFMKGNTLLTGIEPDRSRSLIMNGVTEPQEAELYGYKPFTLNARIINTGLNNYTGSVTLKLVGDAYPFFGRTVIQNGFQLAKGDSVAIDFQVEGLPPGAYHAQLWYGAGADTLVDSTAEYANNDPLLVYGDSVSTACSVFPNPARDYCYVSLNASGATAYQMVNTAGETVASGKIGNGAPVFVLPVQYLANGCYRVVISTQQGTQHLAVVVVH